MKWTKLSLYLPCSMLTPGAARAGSFTSGLPQLVDRMRYTLYGKHRRTTIDASSSARPP
jgi:hypothetical protein